MAKQNKKFLIIIAGFIFYFFDRLFKYLVINGMLRDSLLITSTVNPGIAFGLYLPKVFLIIIIFFIILSLIALLIKAWRENNLIYLASFVLIIFGAASNLLDRLQFGQVIDYFDLHYWPVFNLGDAMIIFGVGIIIIKTLKGIKH